MIEEFEHPQARQMQGKKLPEQERLHLARR
jgi:hypothetical protein